MAKLTITMPDELAEAMRDSAAGNVSEYIQRAVRNSLLEEDLRKLAEFDARNSQPELADLFPQEFGE
ncbi:hypothetical protein HLB23_03240 [Nocardia uniformis]|uniref:Uncharacterized protein n=1 Tax=Nocardia uniformis TaxID=53432 RepID=A0A849C1M0_9NOCA|nr:hypothetical protein [Nocardia uniformis]NNH68899.1 hypothetical protein [Nocardia uniformis]